MQNSFQKKILDAALDYISRGWRVLPLYGIDPLGNCTCRKSDCASPGKHPVWTLAPNGSLDASKNEATVRAWFSSPDNYNIGIATGEKSNLAIVDVDYDKGADLLDLTLDAPSDCLNTISAKTGGGWHYYYKYPKGENLKNSASKLGKFIDVRGDGGYVVAPPSLHASFNYYEWDAGETELLDFPQNWLDKLKEDNPVKTDQNNPFHIPPPHEGVKVPDKIPHGTQHETLFKLACSLRSKGLSVEAIDAALQVVNQNNCERPGKPANITKIAKSAGNYDADIEIDVISDAKVSNWDDISIARLFAAEYEDRLRFNSESKKWFRWTGTHWQKDKAEAVVTDAAEFAQGLYTRAVNLVATKADMKDASKQVSRANSSNGLNSFINIAKASLPVLTEDFDKNPYLLNCKNGVVDLKTGVLGPHKKEDFITKIVPFDFDASAKAPEFQKFIETILPNAEAREFLRRSIGYSLLGIVRERCFWILYGNGNNGKSVFIDLFSALLNDYASSTTSASVMNKKGSSIPNDIARLAGKRFIVIPETEENERLNASLIKALSAGDTITARFLFGEFFDFQFTGKLWIATNHKPTVTDHSKGFWDRLKIIPFTVDIPKQNIIKRDTLLERLLAEAPGILAWAVSGVTEYFQKNDLDVPKNIQDEIDLYRYEQDSIAQFLDESCELDESFETENKLLYEKYVEFCKDNGEYPRSQRRLSQNLKERGFEQIKRQKRYWKGLQVI